MNVCVALSNLEVQDVPNYKIYWAYTDTLHDMNSNGLIITHISSVMVL